MSAHPGPATPPSPYDAIPDGFDPLANLPTSADYPQHELDHAVALERERIAAWLDATAEEWIAHSRYPGLKRALAQAIRNGEHWHPRG